MILDSVMLYNKSQYSKTSEVRFNEKSKTSLTKIMIQDKIIVSKNRLKCDR